MNNLNKIKTKWDWPPILWSWLLSGSPWYPSMIKKVNIMHLKVYSWQCAKYLDIYYLHRPPFFGLSIHNFLLFNIKIKIKIDQKLSESIMLLTGLNSVIPFYWYIWSFSAHVRKVIYLSLYFPCLQTEKESKRKLMATIWGCVGW